ncbi:MAG: hypothetical protein F9K44_12385 [Hyphomicrobiaceae bacterium]|nr:MAG: hypothetical protein F9K44_12385 [Hyphomicrobiaceae bacterium]
MTALQKRLLLAALMIAAGAYTVFVDRSALQAMQSMALGRAAVSFLGVLAGVALLAGPGMAGSAGWGLALLWAIVQIPIFTQSIDGAPNLTVASVRLALTSSSTVNGQVAQYSSIGVNLLALGLAVWLARGRARLAAAA